MFVSASSHTATMVSPTAIAPKYIHLLLPRTSEFNQTLCGDSWINNDASREVGIFQGSAGGRIGDDNICTCNIPDESLRDGQCSPTPTDTDTPTVKGIVGACIAKFYRYGCNRSFDKEAASTLPCECFFTVSTTYAVIF
jgi:hypothetical protein